MNKIISVLVVLLLILTLMCSFASCKDSGEQVDPTVVTYNADDANVAVSEQVQSTSFTYEVKGGSDPYVEDIF